MTINQAFEELISSEDFKGVAKQRNIIGGKYRSYLSRYKKGQLKTGAICEILIANGYAVRATRVTRKAMRKS